MKAFLLHKQKDFDLDRELPPNEQALVKDLELGTLFDAMAGGDAFLIDVAKSVVLSSLKDPTEVVYRQRVLNDCMEQPSVVKEIYDIAVEAIDGERKVWRSSFGYPDAVLDRSVEVLQLFVGLLKQLRRVADEHAEAFRSDGFSVFFEMLTQELDDEYFRTVEDHLRDLRFRRGVLISARLGKGNTGADYVLRKTRPTKWSWRQWIPVRERSAYTLVIPPRDEGGMRALSELRGRGINLVANALAQSTDHILSFFSMVRFELGFYLGCLNLRRQLTAKGEPLCFPAPAAPGSLVLSCRGLYDVGLALILRERRVVGNDVNADDRSLVIVTGANQGGKSTFLRSVGLAQLMMQCGMFVPAEAYRANICDGLFTHYKREEDPTMTSGKLDEELSRMSDIADQLSPNCMVLFNESFAATNEREGAEIARAIVRALLEAGIKVFFVTHSFELAHGFYGRGMGDALFLRAERQADGGRTFRLVEGEPLPTSYGEDLYERIFGEAPDVAPTTLAPKAPAV